MEEIPKLSKRQTIQKHKIYLDKYYKSKIIKEKWFNLIHNSSKIKYQTRVMEIIKVDNNF